MTESAARGAERPYPIRPFAPEELDAVHVVDQHAFHGSPLSETERGHILERFDFDRGLAAFDGTEPVGVAASYHFQLSVPGGETLPAAGVSWVSVLPTYRRRGVLTSLMRRQLADIRDWGEPLALLWASEAPIYSRYGYGRASWQLTFTVKRDEGALGPTAPDTRDVRLRVAEPSAALPELAKIYQTVMPSRPGFFARDEGWWQRAINDPADQRDGAGPLRCLLAELHGEPRAYALYSGVGRWDDETWLADSVLTVRELISASPAAGAALWADLLSRDLTTEYRIRRRPVDDPLLFQLADPRRTRPQLTDALWARIIDVPAALAGRGYSCPVDVVIEVLDELIPENAGAWRLTAGDGGTASCVRATAAPDIVLGIAELGAAYLGGTKLGALAHAGLVTELRPGAVRRLSAAMSWDPAPWCPMIFLWSATGPLPVRCRSAARRGGVVSAMKVTPNAAMRARDVSRPRPEHLAEAERLEGQSVAGPREQAVPAGRPAAGVPVGGGAFGGDALESGGPLGAGGGPASEAGFGASGPEGDAKGVKGGEPRDEGGDTSERNGGISGRSGDTSGRSGDTAGRSGDTAGRSGDTAGRSGVREAARGKAGRGTGARDGARADAGQEREGGKGERARRRRRISRANRGRSSR